MADLAKGLFYKDPHENAPDFVMADISVKTQEFIEFLNSRGEEWTNFQVKRSKAGKPYVEVNEWKKDNAKGSDLPF